MWLSQNSEGWSLMSVQVVVTVLATQCVCKILLFNYIPKHYPFTYIQMLIKTMTRLWSASLSCVQTSASLSCVQTSASLSCVQTSASLSCVQTSASLSCVQTSASLSCVQTSASLSCVQTSASLSCVHTSASLSCVQTMKCLTKLCSDNEVPH